MAADPPLVGGAVNVLRYLDEQIRQGELRPGSRLPAERTIAENLGCSRGDVRHALSHLELEGRVTRHVGRGTFLAAEPSVAPSSVNAASPADLMAARMILEPQVVKLAAISATEADFAEMRRCLDRGDRSDSYHDFEAWDIALHKSFATATHNHVVGLMTGILHTSRNDPVWGNLKRKSHSRETREKYRREHHAIVEALLDRDREAAAEAMEEHLLSIRRHILD